jgi:hypothetical protein
MWCIWRDWNAKSFEDREISMLELKNMLFQSLYTWIAVFKTSIVCQFAIFLSWIFVFFAYFMCIRVAPLGSFKEIDALFNKRRIIGNLWVKEFLKNRRRCLLMDMGCCTYGLPFALRLTASKRQLLKSLLSKKREVSSTSLCFGHRVLFISVECLFSCIPIFIMEEVLYFV